MAIEISFSLLEIVVHTNKGNEGRYLEITPVIVDDKNSSYVPHIIGMTLTQMLSLGKTIIGLSVIWSRMIGPIQWQTRYCL